MNNSTQLIQSLESGLPRTLVVYGTSLSFHLAPLLRNALTSHYGDLTNVVNSGMSAKASRTGLAELESKVIRHHPDTLLLEFAVNDAYSYEEFPQGTLDKGITLQESRDNLEEIIERVQVALPRCEIILQTTNPTYDAPGSEACAGSRRPELGRFYEVVREVAVERGLRLIDNYAMWKTLQVEEPERFKELVPDGAHPNPAAIRSVLLPHLMKELGVVPGQLNVF
jgi:lysophospholipase L1-like esterase